VTNNIQTYSFHEKISIINSTILIFQILIKNLIEEKKRSESNKNQIQNANVDEKKVEEKKIEKFVEKKVVQELKVEEKAINDEYLIEIIKKLIRNGKEENKGYVMGKLTLKQQQYVKEKYSSLSNFFTKHSKIFKNETGVMVSLVNPNITENAKFVSDEEETHTKTNDYKTEKIYKNFNIEEENKIFVKKINEIDDKKILSFFLEKCGPIRSFRRSSNADKCFIIFENSEGYRKGLLLDGVFFENRSLHIEKALNKENFEKNKISIDIKNGNKKLLKEYFTKKCGEIIRIVVLPKVTYISFENEEAYEKALYLDGTKLNNLTLNVNSIKYSRYLPKKSFKESANINNINKNIYISGLNKNIMNKTLTDFMKEKFGKFYKYIRDSDQIAYVAFDEEESKNKALKVKEFYIGDTKLTVGDIKIRNKEGEDEEDEQEEVEEGENGEEKEDKMEKLIIDKIFKSFGYEWKNASGLSYCLTKDENEYIKEKYTRQFHFLEKYKDKLWIYEKDRFKFVIKLIKQNENEEEYDEYEEEEEYEEYENQENEEYNEEEDEEEEENEENEENEEIIEEEIEEDSIFKEKKVDESVLKENLQKIKFNNFTENEKNIFKLLNPETFSNTTLENNFETSEDDLLKSLKNLKLEYSQPVKNHSLKELVEESEEINSEEKYNPNLLKFKTYDFDTLKKILIEKKIPNDAIQILKEQDIDGESFLELNDNDLSLLGIKMGPKKKIISVINSIKNGN
jgi:hypothetical protein